MYVLQPFSIDSVYSSHGGGYQFPTPAFVVFKRLDMHDFCDVKDLGNAGFPDMHYPDTYWCSMLSDQTDIICIGCRDGASGNLLGLITVAPDAHSFLPSPQRGGDVAMLFNYYGLCAYITSLCIHPAYRKLGFGRQLISKAIEELRCLPNPPSLLFLNVADDNLGAIRFYKRTGFSHYTTIPGYYRTRASQDSHLSSTALVFALPLCGRGYDAKSSSSSSKDKNPSLVNRTTSFFSSIKMPNFLTFGFG
ncbi:hypothetical protein PRIPAC_86355 [Pristionchus pacificus]|uniref:Acetyltransferase n=1 Tax=Pristionchus pacificus TaxID=54126 RepID=A0A2A6BN94_PRIPA|nr:hypothetical protein PRIPAC_86355 [Pristionchus pacificus]|eukprot:PDM67432.1 Acetyltransferase [Pristionchus pacificus]